MASWKRVAAAVAAGLLVCTGLCALGLANSFRYQALPVPSEPLEALPALSIVPGLGVSVLSTGSIEAKLGLSVRGGDLREPLTSAMVTVLVNHPRGTLLIDAGMGRRGVEHLATTPLLMQALVDLDLEQGVVEGLAEYGVGADDLAGVLLTHIHWDHVSGLEDLSGVPVWITPEDVGFAQSDESGLLYRQIDAAQPIDVREIRFEGGAYGPFSRHHDFFGDGSVVIVPLPGHTPGSIGVFVDLPSGRRLLFIGDTAWAHEGVDWPAEKPWISRRVDKDPAAVRERLVLLNRLQARYPDLLIVPAHDARVHQQLAYFPDRAQ